MKLDINKLIQERCNFPMGLANNLDPMIDSTLKDSPNRCFVLASDGIFERYYKKNEIIKQYFITAIFDMSTIFYPTVGVKMSIYVLSKNRPMVLKTGRYLGEIKSRQRISDDYKRQFLILPANPLPTEFLKYCNLIENWINGGGKIPNDSTFYDFNIINYDEFDVERPYAHRYTKRYFETINKLKEEKIEMLGEIAEIISPKIIDNCNDGFMLSQQCLVYPFNSSQMIEGRNTATKVQKGDIIINRLGKSYVILDDVKDTYINRNMFIIRSTNILPEYLYVFLNSETGQTIYEAYSKGSALKTLSKRDIENFPIVVPDNQEQYKDVFQAMYVSVDSIDALTKTIDSLDSNYSNLQGILNDETVSKLKLIKDPTVKNIILSDVAELKNCFRCKAYKATLILAGSILEAFLIDWLSEIDGKDYFNIDTRNLNDPVPSSLADFIDAIDMIKRPEWMEEATKAHKIRKSRNMVHAKLCMKKSNQINEDTSKKVIEFLIDIISTRYNDLF